MMITLMLFIALITIALLGVLPAMKQQIRRDREEELIHRGTAYMRAIQHFNRKLGRYPSRLEELENTNNMRFLRKRYTDPVNRDPATGKEREFKLLHQQDITLNNGPVLGQPIGGQPIGQVPPGGSSGFGNSSGGSNFGNNPNALSGQGSQPGGLQQTAGTGTQTPASDSGNQATGGSSDSDGNNSSGLSGPTFGGGPILGVASTSKEKTIRVFFDKNHYKDWLFFFTPSITTPTGLLTGPVNPNMPAGNLIPGATLPGQTNQNLPGTPPAPTQTPPPAASGQNPQPQ